MKIIFSPSKSQHMTQRHTKTLSTKPLFFSQQTDYLLTILIRYSISQLQQRFKISEKKAAELFDIYQNRALYHLPAYMLFSGTSFREIPWDSYSDDEHSYLDNHVCILSAFYGVLRPADIVHPYRLDMTDALLQDTEYKNLYRFWNQHIDEFFHDEEIIINLASGEYVKMLKGIDQKKIITIHFLIHTNDQEKNISVFSKQQRGKLLHYMITHQITHPTDIQTYSSDGFTFYQQRSNENNYFFIKTVN